MTISGPNPRYLQQGEGKKIESITVELQVGKVYEGKVESIIEKCRRRRQHFCRGATACCTFRKSRKSAVERVEDYLQVGQIVQVKLIQSDQGRVRFTMRNLDSDEIPPSPPFRRGRDDRNRGDRGDRGDPRRRSRPQTATTEAIATATTAAAAAKAITNRVRPRVAARAFLAAVLCLPPTAAAGPVYAKKQMVAAAHPAAVRAGLATLEKGGNAIDATIAAQMVLNLVEPQSSGIGGGAFLLYWDPRRARVALLRRPRKPRPPPATEELFAPGGEPMKWKDAVPGGLSVGAPGLVEMLRLAHEERGKLPWADLFAPAIALAETGFRGFAALASRHRCRQRRSAVR